MSARAALTRAASPRENAFNPIATSAAEMKYPSLREGSQTLLPGQYFDKDRFDARTLCATSAVARYFTVSMISISLFRRSLASPILQSQKSCDLVRLGAE